MQQPGLLHHRPQPAGRAAVVGARPGGPDSRRHLRADPRGHRNTDATLGRRPAAGPTCEATTSHHTYSKEVRVMLRGIIRPAVALVGLLAVTAGCGTHTSAPDPAPGNVVQGA